MKTLVGAAAALALLLGTARTAQGQSLVLGARGGVNLFTVAVSPEGYLGEVKAKAGLVAGGFLIFKDEARLGIEVGAHYAVRRATFDAVITDTINYFEVPVVARYRLMTRPGLTLRAIAGGNIGILISAKESIGGQSVSATDAIKSTDTGVVAGAQAEWNKKWLFDFRYQYGLSDVYEVTIGGVKTRQNGFQILVGYRLR